MVERTLRISRLSFALIIAFLLLHLVGARYLYSNVPYDDWSQKFFGFRIGERMGFERNHYDRLVHFSFGLLLCYPLWELYALRRLVAWSARDLRCVSGERRVRNRRMGAGNDVRTRLGRSVQWTAGRPVGPAEGHGIRWSWSDSWGRCRGPGMQAKSAKSIRFPNLMNNE